jgi:hypothetical protein
MRNSIQSPTNKAGRSENDDSNGRLTDDGSSGPPSPRGPPSPMVPADKFHPKDKDNANSKSDTKSVEVRKIRWKAWLLLFISEIILGALVLGQLLSFKNFVLEVTRDNAISELSSMELQYRDSYYMDVPGLTATAQLDQVKEILSLGFAGVSQSQHDDVRSILQLQSRVRNLNYVTLLNNVSKILVSSNANRTGEVWDLGDVVQTLQSTKASYVTGSALLLQTDYRAEDPPKNFVGSLSYASKQSMTRTKTNGLVQTVAVPVFDNNSAVIGYLVGAQIVSGDTGVLENSMGLYGDGISSIMVQDTDGDAVVATEMRTQRGVTSFNLKLSQETRNRLLNKALSSSSVQTEVLSVQGRDYSVAMTRIPGTCVENLFDVTQPGVGILLIGHAMDESMLVFEQVLSATLALTAACTIVDIVGMMVAVRLFIDPLDRLLMFVQLRAYQKYEKLLSRIQLSKRYLIRITIFSLLSVVFLIIMTTLNTQHLESLFKAEGVSKTELQLMGYAFTAKGDSDVSIYDQELEVFNP